MSLIMSRFLKTIESSFDFRGTKTIPQAERRISFLRGGSKAEHSGIFFSCDKDSSKRKQISLSGLRLRQLRNPVIQWFIRLSFETYNYRFRDMVFKLFSV